LTVYYQYTEVINICNSFR